MTTFKIGPRNYLSMKGDDVPGFCAGHVLHSFRRTPAPINDGKKNWDMLINSSEDALLEDIIKSCIPGIGSLFLHDKEGGIADELLFDHVPKRSFKIIGSGKPMERYIYTCKAHVSPYYMNPNSDNMVRHMYVIIKQAVEK